MVETESTGDWGQDGSMRKVLIREAGCPKKRWSHFTGLPVDNRNLSYWMISSVLWIYFACEDSPGVPCLKPCPSIPLPYLRMIFICEFK